MSARPPGRRKGARRLSSPLLPPLVPCWALLALLPPTGAAAAPLALQEPGRGSSPEPKAPADVHAAAGPADLAELRELTELDRAGEVVARGLPLVRSGAALAGEGEAVALVARALAAVGREGEARALLEGAPSSAGSRAWIVLERARLALDRDELERALDHLSRPDEAGDPGARTLRYPDHPESWLLAARATARAGQWKAAAGFAERFVELAPLHPGAPVAWHLLERAALAGGDAALARERRARKESLELWHSVLKARRAQIRRQPDAPEPRLGLALVWMEADEFSRAGAVLEDLAQRAPDYCRLWFHLGECRRRLGRIDAALDAFDRGLACDPGDAKSRFQRAELRWQRGERGTAASDFEALLSTAAADDPRFRALHLRLAQAALERGNRDAARAHYARYRSLGGSEVLEGLGGE